MELQFSIILLKKEKKPNTLPSTPQDIFVSECCSSVMK